jgi:hypothetical protein
MVFSLRSTSFAGEKVEAVGWGTLEFGGPKSNKLQKVELDCISNTACASQMTNITATNICTQTPGKVIHLIANLE